MTITEEIEQVAEGMVETPDKSILKQKKFVSGQDDWLDTESDSMKDRAELIKRAKEGCVDAKYTLMGEPYNIRVLVLNKQIII